jgi:hypothetical protein
MRRCRKDGTILHTHDLRYIISSGGGRHGVDIEFCGRWRSGSDPSGMRMTPVSIRNGRALVSWLAMVCPNLQFIHPHGQIQTPTSGGARTKAASCPGPDIWVNIGEWCTANFGLSSTVDRTLYRHGTELPAAQTNPRWDQGIRGPIP